VQGPEICRQTLQIPASTLKQPPNLQRFGLKYADSRKKDIENQWIATSRGDHENHVDRLSIIYPCHGLDLKMRLPGSGGNHGN